MDSIIEVKNLGKTYAIRHHQGGYVALRDILAGIAKNPLRFAKKKVKDITGANTTEDFWALNDVSFSVEPGEVVGIIGRNGAGKSTLLKILTGITPPTTGEARMHGHVSSLLEVGTGFHPELTGRENIFLNGAILGMSRRDIVKNFDAIVEFSGIEKFLDTPVKYYSSGMYVRLAFSVAAHLEPDILLIDEVLAVGDAEFQKKCLGKMEEVARGAGRTILFVSHNMGAVINLCRRSILIEQGRIAEIGETNKVVDRYLNNAKLNAVTTLQADPEKQAQIMKITILNGKNEPNARTPIDEKISVEVEYEVRQPVNGAILSLLIYSAGDPLLFSSESDAKNGALSDYEVGSYKTTITIPAFLLNVGSYFFDVRLHKPWVILLDEKANLFLEVIDAKDNPRSAVWRGHHPGKIATVLDYKTVWEPKNKNVSS